MTIASRRAFRPQAFVDEEGLRDGRGIGEACGLDDDPVELLAPLHEAGDDADEVPAHGAADAAVVHFEDLFVGIDDEVVIHAKLSELVDDDRIFTAVLLRQDAVEQRRLAGAQIAGEDGDRNEILRQGGGSFGDGIGHGGHSG